MPGLGLLTVVYALGTSLAAPASVVAAPSPAPASPVVPVYAAPAVSNPPGPPLPAAPPVPNAAAPPAETHPAAAPLPMKSVPPAPAPPVPGPLRIPVAAPAANANVPTDPNQKTHAAEPNHRFTPPIHGDLAQVGMVRLVNPFSYAALAIGPAILGSTLFVTADPQFALYRPDWALGLHLPLNLQVLTLQDLKPVYGHLLVRRQDWQEPSDYLKVVRFFTLGHKEDPLYISVSSLQPLSLGHQMLLNRYQGNLDISRSLTSATVDLSNRYAGIQAQVNDLTFSNQLLGGLVFGKPFFWADMPMLRSISLGAEYVADLRAPRCIRRSIHDATCVRGSGNVAGIDPRTGAPRDTTFVNTDPVTGRYVVQQTLVHAAGVSAEVKVLQQPGLGDIKAYTTWHRFLNSRGGSGFALGALGRFTVGDALQSALRARCEYRTFADGFLPSYFDTTYEANKYEYAYTQSVYQVAPTKYQAVFGDPANGFAQQILGRRHGYKLDVQYALYQRSRTAKIFAVGAGVEDSSGPNDASMYLHLEMPAFHALQLFATYLHRNETNLAALFSSASFHSANSVLLSGLRLRVLPILWLNLQYSYSFQITRTPGSEVHMGNTTVVDASGAPSPNFPPAHLYDTSSTLYFQLEFGLDLPE